MSNANDNLNGRKVSSLRDLPRSIEPPRDLWAGIEAKIAAERAPTVAEAPARRVSHERLRWLAAAAVIAALAIGVWIGRSFLPTGNPVAPQVARNPPPPVIHTTAEQPAVTAIQAAYFADPKFREQREALEKSLETKLATLPPQTRNKVLASLAAINKSKQDLEEALGKDPTNALLEELLLNTYQDEMRVLTTVHEASDAGRGI
jgi:hypothetical protein